MTGVVQLKPAHWCWEVSKGHELSMYAQVVDGKHTASLEQVGKIEHFDLTKLRAIASELVGSAKQNVLKFIKCASTSSFHADDIHSRRESIA
jgi:hypothetical protein